MPRQVRHRLVPKLWTETLEEHRRAVHDATLDTTAALVAEHGLASVTMSRIAQETGIGRATLYKYFPDVDAILAAWHDRHVTCHLDHLTQVAGQAGGSAGDRLEAVLSAYALITYERPRGTELAALVQRRIARRVRRRRARCARSYRTAVLVYVAPVTCRQVTGDRAHCLCPPNVRAERSRPA